MVMICAIFAKHTEGIRQLIWESKKELKTQVIEPVLKKGHFEESSYIRNVQLQKDIKNNTKKEVYSNGYKYEDVMESQPPNLSGELTPVILMD